MDVGFVILCPNRNIGGIMNSFGSVQHHTYDRQASCVLPSDVLPEEIKRMEKILEVHKGGDTITSLINVGVKKCKHDWAFIFFAGSRLPMYIEKKFSSWVKKDSDVLFPVINRKYEFSEASCNGILINTKFFKKVGDFPNEVMEKAGLNDFELSKLLWAIKAIEKGVTFKAIVGMKII